MAFLWTLSDLRTPLLERIMQIITYCGQDILILLVICTLYWCVNKRFAYLLGMNYFVAGLMVQSLKITLRIPRPWVLDPHFKAVDSALSGATGYSCPSGHTQGATSLFFNAALFVRRKWLKVLCTLMFLLVGFSRMFLGVHTPKDVGLALGLALLTALVLWHFQRFLLDDPARTGKVCLLLAAVSLAVSIYALLLSHWHIAAADQALDAIKAGGAGLGFALAFYLERRYVNFETHGPTWYFQVLKVVVGLAGALPIKLGFSLLPEMAGLASLEYFLLVFWIIFVYPLLFWKLAKSKNPSIQ